MEVDEEGIRNDFEAACNEQDYSKAAEFLRITRIQLERNPTGMEMIPVGELFSLLSMSLHAELNEQIYRLLHAYFELVDVESVMSSYGGYLQMALQSERTEVVLLGIDIIQRLLVPSVREDLLSTKMLTMVLGLLAHEDTLIGQSVVTCFSKSDAITVFDDHIVGIFEELKRNNPGGLVEARIAQIMASSAAIGDARWREHLEILQSLQLDPLLALVALQEIGEACLTPEDLRSLNAVGLIDRIFQLAVTESRGNAEVAVKALETFASLCDIEDPMVDAFEERFRLAPFSRTVLSGEDISLKVNIYLVLALLATNKAAGRGWVEGILDTIDFAAPVFESVGDLNVAALSACARIFESPTTLDSLQKALFKSLSATQPKHAIDGVIMKCQSLDDNVKQAAYGLLRSMLRHQWILHDSVETSKLVKFLFDREGEPSLVGLQAKYDIIKMIVDCGNIKDAGLLARLQRYLQKGAYYSPAVPSISTLRL